MGHSRNSSCEGLWVMTVPNKFHAFSKISSGFAVPIRADEAVSV